MKIRVGALNGKRVDYFKGVPQPFLAYSSIVLTSSQANLLSKPFSPPPTPS